MKIPIEKFESWLEAKNLKARTIQEYLYYFNKFLPLGGLTQESVSRFLSIKANRNVVARSFLANYQKFLMRNYKEFGINKDIRIEISEIELPKLTGRAKQRLIKPLSPEQIFKIEKHLDSEREVLQLWISFYGGLRLQEMLRIQVLSFNWDEWKKDVSEIGECKVYGKGDKEGIALLPSNLMRRIAIYIKAAKFPSLASYIFLPRLKSLENVDLKNRSRVWQKKLRKVGISSGVTSLDGEGKVIDETAVHPHRLRHSWGYYLRNTKGMDIRDIKDILRHSSIVSTQIYTLTDKSHLKKLLKD